MSIDQFKDARDMLEHAGSGAAKIGMFRNPNFAASQVTHREVIAMGIVIGNLGLGRPDLVPDRTKKDGAEASPGGL